ncbi:MAG TPA: LysR substrate-binding domain-containing protein [Burkholderiales bacterium]|jgi:LysR family cys regulon transcriptional activator|nr:LysR substrate-binding domain-containing protein [Burkholderiales bacterium]
MNIENRLTLRQLACLREIRRQGLNMSAAAAALHTSQPGITRQIQEMEEAIGMQLLIRRRNRVLAFSDLGNAVLAIADRILDELENIRALVDDEQDEAAGFLTVATSHLHARYTLRDPVKNFTRRFPKVQLRLLQADADTVQELVLNKQAEIAVSSDFSRDHPLLTVLPGGEIRRSLIMPADHPLARGRRPTLRQLARYPIVGYNGRALGGALMEKAFSDAGLSPTFVVRAADADVIVTYVEDGLGLAIVPSVALPKASARIFSLDATYLFRPTSTIVSVRRNNHLRSFAVEFIRQVAPNWTAQGIRSAIRGG